MRILITGASRGIGAAIARHLSESLPGAAIAACGAAPSADLEGIVEEITAYGRDAVALTGDLGDPDVPARLIAEACEALGGLDAVVANAAVGTLGDIQRIDLAAWDRMFAVNVRSVWLLARAAHAPLQDSRGAFVTIGSIAGLRPQPSLGPYGASKAALDHLSAVLAQDWAGDGIRVNSVAPGLVLTQMTAAAYAGEAGAELKRRREAMIPLGRIGEPGPDIAGIVEFLLSDAARYCTGQTILADGGLGDAVLNHLPPRPA